MCLRIFDDVIRNPQSGSDSKSVTLSRNADQKPVGRAERLNVELTGRIFHARRRQCIDFQFAVMRCCHRADAAAVKMIQNRSRKCCTFGRISSGTQLIKKNERVFVYLF